MGLNAHLGSTARQLIHAGLKTRLQSITDNGVAVWAKVYDTDISDLDNTTNPCVGIDYGMEEKVKGGPGLFSTYRLSVMFPFRFMNNIGVDVHDLYGYYLGMLQYNMLGDVHLGGLALSVEEDSNATTIVGFKEIHPGGVLSTTITYRTRLNNPYAII